MATLQAATASTGATVTDAQAVRQLCEAHCFRTLNWEVDEEGELIIWGYDDAFGSTKLVRMDFQTTRGLVTHEFLRKLANYLESGEELDIQTAGYTKCRFPVLAKRYVVRDGEVLYADLSTLKTIEE